MIQKLFSTSRYVALSVRVPQKTYWLYFGRGGGFEGLWVSENPPESSLRKIDGLLEYLRKHVTNTTFLKLEIDPSDRVFLIHYGKWRKENTFGYFYKGRESFFAHKYFTENEEKFFTSWDGYQEPQDLNMAFDQIGRKGIDQEGQLKKVDFQKLLEEEKLAAEKATVSKTKQKFHKRKVSRIEEDLRKTKMWKSIENMALTWKEKVQMDEDPLEDLKGKMKIEGIRFDFTRLNKNFEKLEHVFGKIKKLKKAEGWLEKRLLEAKEKIKNPIVEENDLKVIKPVWKKVSSKKREKEKHDYHTIEADTFMAAIGKDAKGNDHLRIQWAKKDDWWFHIDKSPSAHMYLKPKDGFVLSMDILTSIGSLLKDYSSFEGSEIPLVYTQVKNLKGVKGKPGSVLIKKEKRVQVYYKGEAFPG